MMRGLMGIIGAVIIIVISLILAPIVFTQTAEMGEDSQTDTFAAVATGVGVTTADVLLTVDPLYPTDMTHFSVTSDNVGDTPVAGSYSTVTDELTVTGLVADDTRELTVVYTTDALTDFTGARPIANLIPLIFIVGILGLAGAMAWHAFKSGRR